MTFGGLNRLGSSVYAVAVMTAATTPAERWRLGYRPALDGLRAVGVLLVLAAHSALPPGLQGGGPGGVTVFFVLSGFLITALLLQERARTGRIELRRFYLRRVRRLLPPMLPVLALVLVLAWHERQNVALAALYLGNWWELAYPDIGLGIMRPWWTLAVEEQFYLVWPVVLLVGFGSRRWLHVVAPVVGVLLIVAMPGSTMALLVGCAIAFVAHAGRLPRVPRWTGWVGLAAITLTIVGPGLGPAAEMQLSPGVVLATAGAALVVVRITSDHDALPVLRIGPMRWIGLISYGLYLWHYPLLQLGPRELALPVALAAAAASYLLVERRMRGVTSPGSRRATTNTRSP